MPSRGWGHPGNFARIIVLSFSLSPLQTLYSELYSLDASIGILGWDRQVLMPAGGADSRANTLASLVRMRHEKFTSSQLWDLTQQQISAAENEAERNAATHLLSDIAREKKIPVSLVERRSHATSAAYTAWQQARIDRNFALVIPHYETLVELSQEMAEAIGGSDEPYDALLDRYEPGATTADLDQMFGAILEPLISLRSKKLSEEPPALSNRLDRDWEQSKLRDFAESMTRQIGFDYQRGRLDIGPSAFCSSTDRFDVRMTTRHSTHIKGILSSSLHEMGHGLYEQNIRPELAGTPLGHGISLAVHESQSRLWENIIGRHPAFWDFFFPQLATYVDVSEFDAHSFSRAFGAITQNPIRVGSDEVSYNLHIFVRYQLERQLITGSLAARDLEEAWNDAYLRVLGIKVADVNLGVLQDVHWSRGSFGYFPTYAMGNILGGQIWRQLHREIPVAECLMSGNFGPVLDWLTQHIYSDGRTLSSRQLMENVAGSYLDPQPWLDYVHHRYEVWS